MQIISVLETAGGGGKGSGGGEGREHHWRSPLPWLASIPDPGLAGTTLPQRTQWGHRANPSPQGKWPLHVLFQFFKILLGFPAARCLLPLGTAGPSASMSLPYLVLGWAVREDGVVGKTSTGSRPAQASLPVEKTKSQPGPSAHPCCLGRRFENRMNRPSPPVWSPVTDGSRGPCHWGKRGNGMLALAATFLVLGNHVHPGDRG